MKDCNTPARPFSAPRRRRGFTLIELVISMVIAAMLAAIAIPAYSNYVRKSRRAEAKSALLDLAGLEERYYSTQNVYSGTSTDLGYTAWPATVGNGYYEVAAPTVTAPGAPTTALPGGTPATYLFDATPKAGSDQVKDTQCAKFEIKSGGYQQAWDSSNNDNTAVCWR
jgi:type IV pilus assembly protein PilE